jgi:transposase
MIGPSPGARIWIAAGISDLRRGFTGLSAAVQTILEQDPFAGHVFVSVAAAATSLRCCGGMATGCVCFRSVWNAGGSSGPKLKPGPYH